LTITREIAREEDREGSGEAPSEREGGLARRGPTILLVDDEEMVRSLLEELLCGEGYRVLTAASGEEAVEVYREHAAGIELVFLDLLMAGMGGEKCLRELLGIDPSARVILTSGNASTDMARELLEAGARDFLDKPFKIDRLLQAVRGALDES